MGYIYKVAVPQDRWPTARELDAALDRAGEPVRLLVRPDRADEPFEVCRFEQMAVCHEGTPHIVDARDYVFDRENDRFELFDIVGSAGMQTEKLLGAHIFSVVAHGEDADWKVAAALVKRLVLDFGGYGMDFQANIAGTEEWVATLDERMAAEKNEYRDFVARIGADGDEPETDKLAKVEPAK